MAVEATAEREVEVGSILRARDMESAEEMEEVYEDLISELVDVVLQGKDSEEFKELMNTLGTVGNYSSRNKALIKIQSKGKDIVGPFNGYNQWKQFGRVPKKGSDALWILAPVKLTYCDESEERAKYCSECDDRCEDTHKRMVGTKGVKTFAYSQTTELDEKPSDVQDLSPICKRQTETDENKEVLKELYENLKVSVEQSGNDVLEVDNPNEWKLISSARGYDYDHGSEIGIRNFDIGNPEESIDIDSRLATLIHEVAHLLLHREEPRSSAVMEMEAECVSYAVCQNLGIKTDSGVYISNHLQSELGNDMDRESVRELVQESIERIGKTVSEIYDWLK